MKKHTTCLICSSSNLKLMPRYLNGDMQKCMDCNFVFASSIPTIEELIAHYNTYTRDDYLSPITIKRYHEILDGFEQYRKTNKLIDVGCGIGYFLEVAKERGWEVYGTEYTDSALDICRKKGITMHEGKWDPSNYVDGSFDIVTSFEVIEHINNPIEEVQNFNKLLRKGGALYVTTPNFNSLSRLINKEKWTVISYPEHLSYYTSSTLKKLLKKYGFTEKWTLTTGFSITRQKITSQKIDTRYIDSNTDDEKLRVKMETKLHWKIIKSIVNNVLTFFRIGDAMKALYIKN